MATKSKQPPPTPAGKRAVSPIDSRGNTRVYADIPANIAQELKILAIRTNKTTKELLADLIMKAVKPS